MDLVPLFLLFHVQLQSFGELPEHNHVNQKEKGAGDRAELKLFANLLVHSHTGSNLCKPFVVNIT